MKSIVIAICLALLSCNTPGRLHHVEIIVIKNDSCVTGFSVVKFDRKNMVIDSIFYSSPHKLDEAMLARAMKDVPKETPISIIFLDTHSKNKDNE